ncbi:AAA family ATPase [Virgibacillus natechei]
MPITQVEIKNCKSIKDLRIHFNEINCLLGENGTGKTNILKSIKYFYDNLVEKNMNDSLVDKDNPYIQSFEITFYYNLPQYISIFLKYRCFSSTFSN